NRERQQISRFVTYNGAIIATDINNLRRLRVFGWLKADMQKNVVTAELAFKSHFRGMGKLTGAEAHGFRLEFIQELQHIEVETGPNRLAIILAANNLLHRGISPYFPEVIIEVGLNVPEFNLRRRGMPLPAARDLVL